MSAPAPAPSEVTVLLGDPRLPDVSKPGGRYTPEDLDSVVRAREALESLPARRFRWIDDHERLVTRIAESPPAFVLNFCDTGFRNEARREAHVAALLEMLGVPFSGAGPAALTLCYDKAAVRAVAAAHGVPVPSERFVPRDDPAPELDDVRFPALVKPSTGDGSVGITADSVVDGPGALAARVAALRASMPDRDLLVQEFLPGAEYAVGLVGNPEDGFDVLPLLEVDYGGLDPSLPRILAYESKVDPTSPYWTDVRYREAAPAPEDRDAMVRHAQLLFARLGCRDYARFDFRADGDGRPRLLEVNPNPAWCWDGKLALMAGFRGQGYAGLLEAILVAAERRTARER